MRYLKTLEVTKGVITLAKTPKWTLDPEITLQLPFKA